MSKGQGEIISDLMHKISNSMRVSMPGVVETYDYKTQKADIKIDMKELYRDGSTIDYPVLCGVPVVFPKCGGASITMPVDRGDPCLIVFLDRDSTAWLLGGKNTKPNSTRSHHLSDAVVIMGLSPFNSKPAAENNTDMLISFDGSVVRLKPNGTIDIHTAKEVNIKSENLIINCENALIKSEKHVAIECKNVNIKATEIAELECQTLSAKVSQSASIECQTLSAKVNQSASMECQTLSAKVNQSASIECQSANVKASGSIITETPNFTQKGNMKVEGNVEVTGTSKLTGEVTSTSTITGSAVKTSSGKDLATHTHIYQDLTIAIPVTLGSPCTLTKVPTNSGSTN